MTIPAMINLVDKIQYPANAAFLYIHLDTAYEADYMVKLLRGRSYKVTTYRDSGYIEVRFSPFNNQR